MKSVVVAAIQMALTMLSNRIILLYLLLESISGFTQNMAIGEWRIAVPYSNAKALANGKEMVYCVANTFFFGYHKQQNYSVVYDRVWGLNDVEVKTVAYNPSSDIILVAYQNTNIDLIKGNQIINIADIRRSSITGRKTIHSVRFDGRYAYLSCGFGIVVLDIEREEIRATYYIGNNGGLTEVYATAILGNELYAATDIGIQKVDLNVSNPANYQFWQRLLPLRCTDVEVFNNEVYAICDDTLFRWSQGIWTYIFSDTAYAFSQLSYSHHRLVFCDSSQRVGNTDSRVFAFDGYTISSVIPAGSGYSFILDAFFENDSVLYIADLYGGLFRVIAGDRENIIPNGPGAQNVTRIAIDRDLVLFTNGTTRMFDPPVLSQATSGWWYNLNQYNTPIFEQFPSFMPVTFSPSGDKIYVGSYNRGIVVLQRNGTLLDTFTIFNSTMEETIGDAARCKVGGIVFDANGNMWVTNTGANRFLSVRKADGSWRSFKPVNIPSAAAVTDIIIDDYGQKWMIATESIADGIVVFSEGNDVDNTTDDLARVLRKGTGQGNLPSNNVLCIAKDRDGEIWVGTDAGVAVFYCPGSVLTSNGCEAQEILVTAADGFVGTLLGSERVQAIAVDGANRKWIGTTNGLWLFSPDGTQQIHYFSTDNAPLLSNNITALAIDPQTGIVYVGTDRGLMMYRSDATQAEEDPQKEGVLAFPNPVRPDYFGPIAIKGLAEDADVKITDTAGALAFQTKALGGQAIWNGKDGNGNYVKSGVYLVFTSDAEGKTKLVTKVLVMR